MTNNTFFQESSDADGDGDKSESGPTADLSELDHNIARIRLKLEKRYGNRNDKSYTYEASDGIKIRLTPFMMREWSLAIVSYIFLHAYFTLTHPINSMKVKRQYPNLPTRWLLIAHTDSPLAHA
jgi:hypothetical protein